MQGTILVFSNDQMLLMTRRMLFENAGYTVFTAESVSNVMLVLMNHEIDILLLCQSVQLHERERVLEIARALQPKAKCASLGLGDGTAVYGVHTLECFMNPPALLAVIEKIITQKEPVPIN